MTMRTTIEPAAAAPLLAISDAISRPSSRTTPPVLAGDGSSAHDRLLQRVLSPDRLLQSSTPRSLPQRLLSSAEKTTPPQSLAQRSSAFASLHRRLFLHSRGTGVPQEQGRKFRSPDDLERWLRTKIAQTADGLDGFAFLFPDKDRQRETAALFSLLPHCAEAVSFVEKTLGKECAEAGTVLEKLWRTFVQLLGFVVGEFVEDDEEHAKEMGRMRTVGRRRGARNGVDADGRSRLLVTERRDSTYGK